MKLTPVQKRWIRGIYDTPTRTFILSIARKNAKTAFSAFLLLLHLCGPEFRRNSQLYSAAQSRGSGGYLVQPGRQDRAHVARPQWRGDDQGHGKSSCCAPELGTVYRALSADASTAYGLSPVFVVHDELGQVKGPRSELFEALETASAAQEEPLSIVISTQAPTDADLLSVLIDDAIAGHDDRVKCILHTAPKRMTRSRSPRSRRRIRILTCS